jgi:hypothetical protein
MVFPKPLMYETSEKIETTATKGEICPFNDSAPAEMEYDYGEADD